MEPLVIVCKDRAEWLEARRDGLGASDAAAVLGISPWKTNVQLWEEKCRLVQPEDIGDKPAVQYGNDAEPLLRQFFALDHPEYHQRRPYPVAASCMEDAASQDEHMVSTLTDPTPGEGPRAPLWREVPPAISDAQRSSASKPSKDVQP